MKSNFSIIIFLVCSLVGLRNNAMEETDLLLSGETKESVSTKIIMLQTFFNSINKLKKVLTKQKFGIKAKINGNRVIFDLTDFLTMRYEKSLDAHIKLIFDKKSYGEKNLGAVKSPYSGRTSLQEMTYLLLPDQLKLLLLRGVNPKDKGKSDTTPHNMLMSRKISNRLKKRGRMRTLYSSERFVKCCYLLEQSEQCWDHRKQCEFCNKLHGTSNYIEIGRKKLILKNKIESCEHCKGCFLCENRLKKVKNLKCKRCVSRKRKS